ncbi:MAG: hypothetical protein NUW21_06275, partial [Elusimicrobia bacterium]|nr:hypothetical protein [Elusimicrobiota bacterium]
MTTENRRIPFEPRAFLAALGLALASFLSPTSATAQVVCQTYQTVCASACDYTAIQAAVDAIPGTPLAGNWCVDITDNGTYAEQVTVAGKSANGFQIYIGTTTGASRPTVTPPAFSTAAFLIVNTSISVQGLNVVIDQDIPYGVWASSAYARLTDVSVSTSGSLGFTAAGVRLSSFSAVSNSSVTAWNAHGIWLDGGAYTSISNSSMTTNAANYAALALTDSSFNSVTQSYMSNPSGYGASLLDSGYNTISQSVVQNSTPTASALRITATGPGKAVYNLVERSDVFNPAGHAGMISFGADNNDVYRSTFTSNSSIHRALELNNVSSTTVTQSYMANSAGYGMSIAFSTGVSINDSMMESSSGFGLFVDVSSGVKWNGSKAQGNPAVYVRSSTQTAISSGELNTFGGGKGLWIANGNVGVSASFLAIFGASAAEGILLDGPNTGVLSFSSVTIAGPNVGFSIAPQAPGAALTVASVTFQGLNAGATAFNLTGGILVSTFSGVNFADGSIAVNVNAAALAGGSRVTMAAAAGPRAGPAFENDPAGFVDWPGFTGGGVAGLSALGYTGISAGGFTANWSSTLPGGTVFYLKLSTNTFATINSTHSTTNTNFTFSGLVPSTAYNVRLSTSAGAGDFLGLGSVTTPAGGGAAVNFNFFSNGASVIASANGQNETGLNVVADSISGDIYVVFASTPGATASRNDGHDTAGVVGLAKYGPAGNFISSRTLAIDSDGTMALDGSGNVFVAELDKSLGVNSRRITKYGPALNPLASRAVSSASTGGFGALISDGSTLFALIEDRNDDTAKLVAYDSNLTALATAAPFGLGAGMPIRGHGITGDGSGFGYVLVSSDSPNAPVHLLKYPVSPIASLDLASPASQAVLPDVTNKQNARVAMAAGMVYVAFPSPAGTSVLVREYDSGLNYTGVSSTITNTAAPFGKARVAIESDNQTVFVAATSDGGGGGDYLVTRFAGDGLAFISSATYNSPTFLPDQAFGLALGSGGEVFVTGASSDTIANANAATVRLMLAGAPANCGPSLLFAEPVTAVSTHSLTFNWTPDGCPSGTLYTAMISSDAFTTIAASLQTTDRFAAFANLQPGTAYSAKVSTTGAFAGSVLAGTSATFDTGTLSISGTVGYAGFQPGGVRVEAFTTPSMAGAPAFAQKLSGAAYYLPTGAGTFYLRASLDVLGDGIFRAWADNGTLGPVAVSGSSVT